VALFLLLAYLFLVCSGCDKREPEEYQRPELLIYCGITMARPIRVLADRLEEKKDCTVKIMLNGSGNLYRSLTSNRTGDLFLPGSALYMQRCQREKLVDSVVEVGSNRATLVVRRGNPLKVKGELASLVDPAYRVVLGDPDTGSIGRETKRILGRAGLYEQALDHALALTTDSKGLTRSLCENRADLTLNWRATTFWPENREKIEALDLDPATAPPHPLLLGRLVFSRHPELARAFMALATDKEGRAVFRRYGFQ